VARVSCPGEITVDRFLAGALDEPGRQHVLGHLSGCVPCCRLLGALMTSSSNGGGSGSLAPLSHGPEDDRARLAHYRVGDPIGFGGMGIVYSAYDPRLDRRVALKVLWGDGGGNAERLHREARAMAKLAHPNVVPVFDVGVDRGRVFVAMELVLGGTMRAWLAGGPRPYGEVLARFRQAGAGLAAAHHAGLVHRDFKPENLLVRADGTVLVTDFGLARAANAGALSQLRAGPLPSGTESAGTPPYMAPEQLRGEPLDARADVYAFSVSLWEALFGQRPFLAGTPESLLASIARGPVLPPPRPALPAVPPDLPRALAWGMAFSPSQRPSSIAELLSACEAAAGAPTAPPQATSIVPTAPAKAPRGGLVLVGVLALAALAASAIAVVVTLRAPRSEPSAQAPATPRAEEPPRREVRAAPQPQAPTEPPSAMPSAARSPSKAPPVAPGSVKPAPAATLVSDAGVSPAPPLPASGGMRIRGTDFGPYGFEADEPLARARARTADFATCVAAAPACKEVTCTFTVGPSGAVASATCKAWKATGGECSATSACLTSKVRAIRYPPPPSPGECQLSFWTP